PDPLNSNKNLNPKIVGNVLWYGVVRDYEAISYQVTPTFFTSHKPSKTTETRMHYTMCWGLGFFINEK
ncbi:MAG: hypothetical protein ACOCWG_05805, partial [bacterium]